MAWRMIWAVFDCNIFVQALLNPKSVAAECLDSVRAGRVILFLSKDTLAEIRDVVLRPNITSRLPAATAEQIESFIADLLKISVFEKDIPKRFVFERDPKDEIIIDLALACKADYVVSRDRDLLDLMTDVSVMGKEFRQKSRPLKIVEPLEFLKIIEAQDLSLNP